MNKFTIYILPLIKYATNTPKFLQRFNIKSEDTEKVTNNIVSSIHSYKGSTAQCSIFLYKIKQCLELKLSVFLQLFLFMTVI